MTVTGYKGVAILAIDGKSQRIALEPVGQLALSGKAAGALPKQPKGVVQITPPNGKADQREVRLSAIALPGVISPSPSAGEGAAC